MKILRHRLIAGDSNRKGHLKLNAIASSFLLASAVTRLPFLGGTSYLAALSWLTIAASCLATEVIIPPDVDYAEKWSGDELYHNWWKIFGDRVPHRSKWSHSLLLGLPMRIAWGLLPAIALMAGLGILGLLVLERLGVEASVATGFLAKAFEQAIAIDLFRNIAIGAIISDCVHYTLDDYNPIEWVIGKGNDKDIAKFIRKFFKPKRKRKHASRAREPVAAPKARPRS